MMAACIECGATLRYVTMKSGRRMPCDPVPVPPVGRIVEALFKDGSYIMGRVLANAPENFSGSDAVKAFRPHFCRSAGGAK